MFAIERPLSSRRRVKLLHKMLFFFLFTVAAMLTNHPLCIRSFHAGPTATDLMNMQISLARLLHCWWGNSPCPGLSTTIFDDLHASLYNWRRHFPPKIPTYFIFQQNDHLVFVDFCNLHGETITIRKSRITGHFHTAVCCLSSGTNERES